jgi:hypothetical protein
VCSRPRRLGSEFTGNLRVKLPACGILRVAFHTKAQKTILLPKGGLPVAIAGLVRGTLAHSLGQREACVGIAMSTIGLAISIVNGIVGAILLSS